MGGSLNAQLDGRIEWNGTFAALKATMTGLFPNNTTASTTDMGLAVYNAALGTWVLMSQSGGANYGFLSSALSRWRPSGNRAQTLTAAISGSATSGVLNANWTPPNGFYPIITSASGSVPACYGYFTQGSTAVTYYQYPTPAAGRSPGAAFAPPAATASITVQGTPPVAASANAVLTSSAVTHASGIVPTVGALDVPRALVGAWTNTAIVTITGTDVNGQTQTEASASGTTYTGKKSFATVTHIDTSADITGCTIGTSKIFGLPVRVSSGDLASPMFNDAADAGTFVYPDLTNPATSTTGDVRGTYTPSGSPDGAKYLSAIIKPADSGSQFGTQGIQPA